MGARWKGKGSEIAASSNPMSRIVANLWSSLIQLETCDLLFGSAVLIGAMLELSDLLYRACFGRPIVNADADKQWFQLSLEEAFYLSNDLNSLKIIGDDKCPKSYDKVWRYMMSKKSMFPDFYKAYSHLRTKNWVVRSGSQYGVDFVAYRHHPALVHSEYAVIVTSEDANEENPQLKVWSDFHCTIRLCGSVTKTLLVLNIKKNDQDASLPSCLERFNVGELTIKRWNPDRCRENKLTIENGPEHQGRVRGLGFEATPSSVGATA